MFSYEMEVSQMDFTEISTIEQWENALEGTSSKPALLFKHSTSCSISAAAQEELSAYLNEERNENVNYYLVKVIESRPVSNQIAEDLSVRHQSPQIIYIDNKTAKWDKTHWSITHSLLSDRLG